MCSNKKKLSILIFSLRCFYKERSLLKKLLRNTHKSIQNIKKYTPKNTFKILLQNDIISEKLSLIDFYLEKIDYLNSHISNKKITQARLLNEINNSVFVDEKFYDYYPPVCIETILGRYENEKAA